RPRPTRTPSLPAPWTSPSASTPRWQTPIPSGCAWRFCKSSNGWTSLSAMRSGGSERYATSPPPSSTCAPPCWRTCSNWTASLLRPQLRTFARPSRCRFPPSRAILLLLRPVEAAAEGADGVEVDVVRHLVQHPVDVFQGARPVALLSAGQAAQHALAPRRLWLDADDRVEV